MIERVGEHLTEKEKWSARREIRKKLEDNAQKMRTNTFNVAGLSATRKANIGSIRTS